MVESPIPAREDPRPLPRFLVPIVRYLRDHPIVALLLLTPGIPEYLSSSSSLDLAFEQPLFFLLFLAANLGMYLPGALLIREAKVRWQKGFGSVIVLGAAYAIVEEGIGLSTMFNSRASVVGGLGFYGHYLGVNWVWITGVVMIHVVYSISIPILLFGYALPEWRDRPLLSARGLRYAFAVLTLDIVALLLVVNYGLRFFMGFPVLVGALLTIAGLVALARWLPADVLRPRARARYVPPVGFALVGLVLFPGTILIQGLSEHFDIVPFVPILLILAFYAALLGQLRRGIAPSGYDAQTLAFVCGALAPIAALGLVGSFPATLVASLALAYFLYRMWARYAHPTPGSLTPIAPGAGAA